MSEELINKQSLIKELKKWLSEFEGIPETLYGQGYDDAIKAAIAIVENEVSVNAVELPCKIEDKIFEVCKQRYKIYERTVKGFTVSDRIELINCETKNFYWFEIGKKVFLTRGEAEKALEDLKNDK